MTRSVPGFDESERMRRLSSFRERDGSHHLGVERHWVGRDELAAPPYYKIDVAGHRALIHSSDGKSALSLTMRVDNVLDRKYEDVLNFPAPRRTWTIGARIEGVM